MNFFELLWVLWLGLIVAKHHYLNHWWSNAFRSIVFVNLFSFFTFISVFVLISILSIFPFWSPIFLFSIFISISISIFNTHLDHHHHLQNLSQLHNWSHYSNTLPLICSGVLLRIAQSWTSASKYDLFYWWSGYNKISIGLDQHQ